MSSLSLTTTLSGHQNPIYCLAIDEEHNILYSGGNDKGIVEWDLESLTFKRILCTVPASVYAMKLIPDTHLLVAALRKGGLLVVDSNQQKLVSKLEVESGAVFSMEILSAKNEIIAADESGRVYVWSISDFTLLYSFHVSNVGIRTISFLDSDKKYLAFGDKDGVVYLYNAEDFTLMVKSKIHETSVSSLAFVEGTLYSGGRDAKLYQLDLHTLRKEKELTPHMFTVYGIIPVFYNGNFITISRDKTIKLWNNELKLQKNISRDKGIDSHYLSINTAVFSKKTALLFTAGDDKMIKVWRLD